MAAPDFRLCRCISCKYRDSSYSGLLWSSLCHSPWINGQLILLYYRHVLPRIMRKVPAYIVIEMTWALVFNITPQ